MWQMIDVHITAWMTISSPYTASHCNQTQCNLLIWNDIPKITREKRKFVFEFHRILCSFAFFVHRIKKKISFFLIFILSIFRSKYSIFYKWINHFNHDVNHTKKSSLKHNLFSINFDRNIFKKMHRYYHKKKDFFYTITTTTTATS